MPKPKPAPVEVLVEVKASAFNHLDIWVREGWPSLDLQLPHICGSDAAGIVRACGSKIDQSLIGGRVAIGPGINTSTDVYTQAGEDSVSSGYRILGEHFPGAHAEYICVPASNVIQIPEHINFTTAAAAGLVCLSSWRMRAKIEAGQTVLLLSAGGGVNSTCIQLAKLLGCTVFATTSTTEKMELAKNLGADEVVNYREDTQWAQRIYEFTHHHGVDVVVDNIGTATLMESIRCIKRGGKIVIVGNTSGP